MQTKLPLHGERPNNDITILYKKVHAVITVVLYTSQ